MTSTLMPEALLWLGTYAVHSTVILGGVFVVERLRCNLSLELRETLWRTGLLAAVLTATLQTAGLVKPVVGGWDVPVHDVAANAPVAMPDTASEARSRASAAVRNGSADDIRLDDRSAPSTESSAVRAQATAPTGGRAAADSAVRARSMPRWPAMVVGLWLLVVSILTVRLVLAARAAGRALADRVPIVDGYGELVRETMLAELAADDWSAGCTGNGRALAECLAEFAAHAPKPDTPIFAAAMARPDSPLVARVRRLLDRRGAERAAPLPRRSKVSIGIAVVLVAVAIPGLQAQDVPDVPDIPDVPDVPDIPDVPAVPDIPDIPDVPDVPDVPDSPDASGSFTFHSEHIGTDATSFSTRNLFGSYRLDVEADGGVELAPDASGVAALASGSRLDATLKRDGTERRIQYRGVDGRIERDFWVDGEHVAWGAEAEAFVAELMPILFRTTGIGAKERVAWLLETGGHDAVLGEIDLIESDSVQQLYTRLYAEAGPIPASAFHRLMALDGEQIGSGSQLRAALAGVLEAQRPTGDELIALIEAAQSIGSDSQARALLETIARVLPDADDAITAYLAVAKTIGSDSQLRAALAPIVAREDLTDLHLGRMLELAGDSIDSDSQLRAVLVEAAAHVGASDELARAYTNAARSIGSDSQSRAALLALGERAELSSAGWRLLLTAARDIGSDSQCASLLESIAARMPRDPEIVAAYTATADTIGSDSQHRRAMQALNGVSL